MTYDDSTQLMQISKKRGVGMIPLFYRDFLALRNIKVKKIKCLLSDFICICRVRGVK